MNKILFDEQRTNFWLSFIFSLFIRSFLSLNKSLMFIHHPYSSASRKVSLVWVRYRIFKFSDFPCSPCSPAWLKCDITCQLEARTVFSTRLIRFKVSFLLCRLDWLLSRHQYKVGKQHPVFSSVYKFSMWKPNKIGQLAWRQVISCDLMGRRTVEENEWKLSEFPALGRHRLSVCRRYRLWFPRIPRVRRDRWSWLLWTDSHRILLPPQPCRWPGRGVSRGRRPQLPAEEVSGLPYQNMSHESVFGTEAVLEYGQAEQLEHGHESA